MTQGDRGALQELYGRHASTLLASAQTVLRDRQEAEDVIHDVLLEAWQRCSDYSAERGSVRSWLMTRTRCRALDRLRSRTRRHALATNAVHAEQHKTEGRADIALLGQHRLPAALAKIPEIQQHVIVLAYFEGLTTPEISVRLGIPTGTVKSRTHAAIAALRGMLGVSHE